MIHFGLSLPNGDCYKSMGLGQAVLDGEESQGAIEVGVIEVGV